MKVLFNLLTICSTLVLDLVLRNYALIDLLK